MRLRSIIIRIASAAVLFAAIWVSGGCDSNSHQVLYPSRNEIPPGPSPVVEETRPVSGVRDVVLAGVGRVYIEQGGAESLRVRTQEHILPFIRTEMRNGQLVLGFKEATSYNGQASVIEFFVTLVDLERAELRGIGGITASSIHVDHLSLVRSGVGGIDFSELDATRLDATTSGVGEITVNGRVNQQSVILAGFGGYDARHLESTEAEVTIRSMGSATVRVSDRLTVRMDGGGSVYYLGSPVVQRTGGGSGRVQSIGE